MIIYKCDRCKKEISHSEYKRNNIGIHFDFERNKPPMYLKIFCRECIELLVDFIEKEVE